MGYAKSDLVVPAAGWSSLAVANAAAIAWCAEVNGRRHADIAAVPHNADGQVVAGSLSDAIQTRALWTFRRDTNSRDPNWLLLDRDPRVTRVGRVLRKTSLDELPQLWNVLKGEMSIIGPRPTLPEQVMHYSQRQRGRLAIQPGLTGYAQVKGRNALSWPERIELDLWYIENRSVWLDVRIIALTMLQLVRPEGINGDGGINPGFPVPAQPADDADPSEPREDRETALQPDSAGSSEVSAA